MISSPKKPQTLSRANANKSGLTEVADKTRKNAKNTPKQKPVGVDQDSDEDIGFDMNDKKSRKAM